MTGRNHGSDLARRLLCAALAIVMALSLAACGADPTTGAAPSTTQNIQVPSSSAQPVTQPTTAPTDPDVPASTAPTEPPETEPSYELEYKLTHADVDEYYRLLDECEKLSLAGEDMDAIDASVLALEEQYQYLDAQCSIATIFHYSHTADKELEQQYLDTVDICTDAHDAYIQMVRRIYQSDSPAKESLFEDWTDEEIASLLSYDEQIVQLQQRNAEIGVEYRTSTDDARKIELYIEFVQNNNKIAQFYDYDNYYTYAYERVNDRDYGQNELKALRQYAKTYLRDIYDMSLDNFYASFYNIAYSKQLQVQNFLYGDYNTLSQDYVGMYIDAAPEGLSNALRDMLDHDSMFTDADDAKAGAFTTMIGDRSYCYFGPNYWSANTVLHEGGHYYASQYSDLNAIPLDLAEVHSQANEWLFISFVKENLDMKMDSLAYRAVVDYKLYEVCAMGLMCLMVDEFEERVYTTDLTGFTAEDFDAIMDDIAKQYFPDGDVATMLADMNSYWRLVVVEQPVYYISYAVSGIAAVSLFTAAEEDYDEAMAIYQKLCEEPVLEAGFLGNIKEAGLATPFDEAFYKDFKALIEDRS